MNDNLQHYKQHEFSLVQLVNTAQSLIERLTKPPSDGRIAPFPDTRTVRYYQTIGIIRKPLRYDGRNAVYGYLHLLQLITIKLLQAEGLSLNQIQSVMVQATQADLEEEVMAVFTASDKENLIVEDQSPRTLTSPPILKGKIERKRPRSAREFGRSLEVPIYKRQREKEKNLIAMEVAAGITVLIDPDKISDPEEILKGIMKLLNHQNGEK